MNKAHSGTGYKGFTLPRALDANLLNLDEGDHARLRRLVAHGFTPRRVEGLRSTIRDAANRLADTLSSNEQGDVVADFAIPLPLTVISDLLAVPESDRRPFAAWVRNMFTPEHPGQIRDAVSAIHAFLGGLVENRRRSPGDDLLSALISARDEGDRLSEDELVSLAFLILMAGVENVQHLISAGLLTLLRHPDQLAEIRSNPGLLPSAVEELLRYAHPNQMAIRRFATEIIEIGGVQIPKGDTVMLCLAAAHRDPARYPAADRFEIHRKDKTHLALGQGLHYCLGASLARAEIQIGLGVLLERFPHLRLAVRADELEWRSSWRSRALRRLPLQLRSAHG
ncbi:cytochrome P450 [Streptomyces sp. NPDC059037]|uniref:cytochrome P450 family protein n=1 Tax=Streptomyces sp. NPDC059037 TaxID=3346710 RepID=UPI0036C95631